MNGLLVRVGIDSTSGGWNAPIDPRSGRFVYVPIPEEPLLIRDGLCRDFDELIPALQDFGITLPPHLLGRPMHLDPDFKYLTFGDRYPRNIPLQALVPGDFIIFYAGMRSIWPEDRELVYALIGFYEVDEVLSAASVPPERWNENAHTRRKGNPRDIIVRARPGRSGRLARCIPIGEYRDRAYRVRQDILAAWGGLTVRDGYLQRSGRLPAMQDPLRFLRWFASFGIPLVRENF
ncbi:MAG TPA: hypothetical protein PLN56_08080 [Methanoregulaceae archaeon]|nr:MAG: hypothetical protein IPI71_00475 [Methanolinea sp.]HON82198.1 hypothetical protein [Methanoregulaceae archaeon]HPD10941.1 hypothetical protein [Methanoregulaceae archaeon]HRT16084.1 hypothetical protein [Methanoregulaceae archaeon]HRU31590.1 hypothetical protein [Methanoregulaceae archaeon]